MNRLFRVALLDSDADVRFGRKMVISSNPNFEIVYESEGVSEDLVGISDGLIDVLVADQRLASGPGVGFYEALRTLGGIKQATACVITSAFDQPALEFSALEQGVFRVISLEQGPEALLEAIGAAKAMEPSHSLAELYALVLSESPKRELDLNLLRIVNELPQRQASNLRKLRSAWNKADSLELEKFDLKGLTGLVDRLPVKTVSELVIRLQRSGLLDGE